MPININDTTKYKNDVQLSYNYNSVPIYINQFKNTIKSDGFIKIPYASNGTDPNVIIVDDNKTLQYKTTDLYIIKSQKLIDISYSAELIVQHKSTTNEKVLFTCFLLDSSNNLDTTTNIDTFINDSENNGKNSPPNKTLSLQNLITTNSGKTIYFKPDDNTTIIVLTIPFIIQTVFDSSLNNLVPPLFETSPTDYKIIEPIVEKFSTIEGFTKNMYCQPVDMTDPSGEIIAGASLSIPLEGKYSPNNATNNIIRTAINFMAFVLILGFTYMMTPIIYNDFMIGLIQTTATAKLIRIRSIDIYTCIIFILLVLGFISQGVSDNNPNSTILGFFLGIFFIISFVIIQSKKMTGTWFQDTFSPDPNTTIKTYYSNINIQSTIEDFFKFISENFMIFFGNLTTGLMAMFTFLCIFYLMGSFKKGGIMSTGNGLIFLILFVIYLTILISTKSNP